MARKKRDEPNTLAGKTRKFPAGGKAGRTPGLGTRNNSGTRPGSGADKPSQGYGLVSETQRKPPPGLILKPKIKPEDQTEGGEGGN